MNLLLGFLCHDRPDALQKAVPTAVSGVQSGARLVVHVDAGDYQVLHEAKPACEAADLWFSSPTRVGVAASLNKILAHRKPEEHFCWLSSDTVIEGDDWLPRLLEGLDTYQIVAPSPEKIPVDPARWVESRCPASGAVLFHASVMRSLGAFHAYGKYGCTDLDYYVRAHHAGYRIAYDTEVRAETPLHPERNGSRKEEVEAALVEFKKMSVFYERQEMLYQSLEGSIHA